eukprot:snap_masked-scaffold_4-processed-gene-20.2-mRNA-1 protein AED:1.00 eAED:1.00 QI:0/-1/0/0/-1/1/1/0/983
MGCTGSKSKRNGAQQNPRNPNSPTRTDLEQNSLARRLETDSSYTRSIDVHSSQTRAQPLQDSSLTRPKFTKRSLADTTSYSTVSRPRSPKETIKHTRNSSSVHDNVYTLEETVDGAKMNVQIDLDKVKPTRRNVHQEGLRLNLDLNIKTETSDEDELASAPVLSPQATKKATTVNLSVTKTYYHRREKVERNIALDLNTIYSTSYGKSPKAKSLHPDSPESFIQARTEVKQSSENKEVNKIIESTRWSNQNAVNLINLVYAASAEYHITEDFYQDIAKKIKSFNDQNPRTSDRGINLHFKGKEFDRDTYISEPEMRMLSVLLKDNYLISSILINTVELNVASLKILGQGIKFNSHLCELNLRHSKIDCAKASVLMKYFEESSSSVTRLDLSENAISNTGMFSIFRVLLSEQINIKTISLSNNPFSEESFEFILEVLPAYCKIEEINLVEKVSTITESVFGYLNKIHKTIERNLVQAKLLRQLTEEVGGGNEFKIAMAKFIFNENFIPETEGWLDKELTLLQKKRKLFLEESALSGQNANLVNLRPKDEIVTRTSPKVNELLEEYKQSFMISPKKKTSARKNVDITQKPKSQVHFSFGLNQGCRAQMQDAVLTKTCFRGNANESVFGIFDGHGGVHCARFIRANFLKEFELSLKNNSSLPLSEDEIVRISFSNTFASLQNSIKKHGIPHGSCAVIIYIKNHLVYTATAGDSQAMLIQYKKNEFHSARNSKKLTRFGSTKEKNRPRKAIAQKENKSSRFSPFRKSDVDGSGHAENVNHLMLSTVLRPTDDIEERRIFEAGGLVLRGRVDGVLAVSRALGDVVYQPKVTYEPIVNCLSLFQYCSKCLNRQQSSHESAQEGSKGLSCESRSRDNQISGCSSCKQLNQDRLNYIIIASDGLWDVMNPSAVEGVVTEELLNASQNVAGALVEESNDILLDTLSERSWEIAAKLCSESVRRLSRDNISTICISLETPLKNVFETKHLAAS